MASALLIMHCCNPNDMCGRIQIMNVSFQFQYNYQYKTKSRLQKILYHSQLDLLLKFCGPS